MIYSEIKRYGEREQDAQKKGQQPVNGLTPTQVVYPTSCMQNYKYHTSPFIIFKSYVYSNRVKFLETNYQNI